MAPPVDGTRPMLAISGSLRKHSQFQFDLKYFLAYHPPLRNASNTTASPLPCPQPGLAVSDFEENCLSMILYVPPTARLSEPVPTLMWFDIKVYMLARWTF